MRVAILVMMMTACGEELTPIEWTTRLDGQAPPTTASALATVSRSSTGGNAIQRCVDVGDKVWLHLHASAVGKQAHGVASVQGTGPGPCGGGVCLDIVGPVVKLGTGLTEQTCDGYALPLSFEVPAFQVGTVFHVQGVVEDNGSMTTNVIELEVCTPPPSSFGGSGCSGAGFP